MILVLFWHRLHYTESSTVVEHDCLTGTVCQTVCHVLAQTIISHITSLSIFISPDFLGEEGHDICILLNEAYATLSDPITRDLYNHKLEQTLVDYEDDFTGNPLSKWMPTVNPKVRVYCIVFHTV